MRNSDGEARQLTLDLGRDPCYEPEEFLVSPSNAHAHAMIDRWPDWPERILLLRGPAGSGKSHLGAIWAVRAEAPTIRPHETCALGALMEEPKVPPRVLLEDCDRAAYDETTIFHLLNFARETGGWIVATARRPPDMWGIKTPDLLSRLRLAPSIAIDVPGANLIKAVLAKLFADRQIRVDDDVISYAALHCEQSLEAINGFVAAIDEEGLASGRRITRQLAARTLERLEGARPPEL